MNVWRGIPHPRIRVVREHYRASAGSQECFNHSVCLAQRGIQGSGIFSSGLCQIRTTAALAANLLRNRGDYFSGLNAAGQILGDADNE